MTRSLSRCSSAPQHYLLFTLYTRFMNHEVATKKWLFSMSPIVCIMNDLMWLVWNKLCFFVCLFKLGLLITYKCKLCTFTELNLLALQNGTCLGSCTVVDELKWKGIFLCLFSPTWTLCPLLLLNTFLYFDMLLKGPWPCSLVFSHVSSVIHLFSSLRSKRTSENRLKVRWTTFLLALVCLPFLKQSAVVCSLTQRWVINSSVCLSGSWAGA